MDKLPPRQKFIKDFVIYAALGIPRVNIDKWRLRITGLVKRQLEYTYNELLDLMDSEYVADFHCVTRWSIKDVKWKGISLRNLIDKAGVKNEAKWVFVESVDGYTTTFPLEDALNEKSIVALYMNGKPLTVENGFPARIFVPHLYGWKSAKWVYEIEFVDKYVDGYWEKAGYHVRGNVWKNERFK